MPAENANMGTLAILVLRIVLAMVVVGRGADDGGCLFGVVGGGSGGAGAWRERRSRGMGMERGRGRVETMSRNRVLATGRPFCLQKHGPHTVPIRSP